jgi:hypothetical protein
MRAAGIASVVVAVCLCGVTARGAFVNESFESGDFTGWTVGGNEHGVALANAPILGTDLAGNYVKPRTGASAAWVKLGTTDPPTTFSLEQTVAVTPGSSYQWGLSHGVFTDPPTNNSQFGLRRWINGSLFSGGTGSIGSNYMGFITGFTAPPGSNVATFKIEWTGNRDRRRRRRVFNR